MRLTPTSIVNQAETLLKEYRVAQGQEEPTKMLQIQGWKAPPEGFMKINFDGAVCSRESIRGVGIIIRDNQGVILGAYQSAIIEITDPLTIETLAATKRLLIAKELGLRQITLEGDALRVMTMLNSSMPDFSPLGNLFDKGRVLKREFGKCLILQVRREALRSENEIMWFDNFPCNLVSICQKDCNLSL
ncbi:hypothetical protein PTKIN_Ptkin14bG0125200 [Pterospermum kingtungense]